MHDLSPQAVEAAQRPQIQPITQICAKDTIEIAINFFSLEGLLNLDSVEWFPPFVQPTPVENALTYDKDRNGLSIDKIMKIHCDLSRICEVEDSVVEWYQTEFFQRQEETLDGDWIAQLSENF